MNIFHPFKSMARWLRSTLIKMLATLALAFVGSIASANTGTASFSEAFGGTTISEDGTTFTYPAAAEVWGGFANMNADLYPLGFSEAGSITFNASVPSGGSADVRFRLEFQPHPNVDPAYDTSTVTVSGSDVASYSVAVPSQGANTFSSLLMYVVTPDVSVTITDVIVDAELPVAPADVPGCTDAAADNYNADATTDDGSCVTTPVTVSVTFSVDMSAVDTNADGVYIAGGGFGQDGHALTNDGNDVWSVTLDLAPNAQYLYKFRNQPSYGTWDGFEDPAGLIDGGCNIGQYNDRYVDVAEADIVLPVVAYESCTSDPWIREEIIIPTAPVPSDAADSVLSIFSTTYGNLDGTDFNPNWGQSTSIEVGDNLLYSNLNYQGTGFANQDVSGYEYLNVDYYVEESTAVNFFVISPGAEKPYALDVSSPKQWNSVQIPLSHYDNVNLADVFQFKVDGNGSVAFNNIYFGGVADVPGCTNELADNYNPAATSDDGSCLYTVSVTFSVDMNAVDTNADGVYLAGGVFGQDGHALTNDGNDVWSVTLDLNLNTQYLYKFRNQPSYGTWDGFEDPAGLIEGGCAIGDYNDRFVDVAEENIVLDITPYGECYYQQSISVSNSPKGILGKPVVFEMSYDTNANNNQLTGLGLRVHFDSSVLSYSQITNLIEQDIIISGQGPFNDGDDFDNDPSTDKYILFGWASLYNNWPNVELPAVLMNIAFDVLTGINTDEVATTSINFTETALAADHQFDANNYDLDLVSLTWDFDGNGVADALTDGLMMLRYLFGVTGDFVTDNAIAINSSLSSEEVIAEIQAAFEIADVDDDGEIEALTDGLMLLRYLFGIRGDVLIAGAISSKANRTSSEAIEAYIETYMPPM